jgi:phytoene dehydrogenase-like protein
MHSTNHRVDRNDLIVIGGGLAGLIAAALVARTGRKVVVLERSGRPGGRAITRDEGGIRFNLGPHALYRRGHAFRLFRELGIPFSGGFPDARRGVLTDGDRTYALPRGLGSIVASRLLTFREKARLLRLFATLPRLDSRSFDRVPLRDWIRETAGDGHLAGLLRTLCRVSTYVDDPDRLSAATAIDQLKNVIDGGVWYLDGGWQVLIDGLREDLMRHGVELRTSSRAGSVRRDVDGVTVAMASGEELHGRTAVLAIDPEGATTLLDLPDDSPLASWTARCIPVRAACLDVALSRLPRPDRRVAFALDRPLYFSDHSASARLAPEGVAVLHVMKYLGTTGIEGPAWPVEGELEAFLEMLQPGWWAHVVTRRFLPEMTVAHSLPRADDGGLAGRPGVEVPGFPNVFLAGDWVGAEGMLADAAAASASAAARRALEVLSRAPVPAGGSVAHATA